MPIGYKLFRLNKKYKGKIFPLFVNTDKETPIEVWVKAECGELTDNGKVKSKLGQLCYRPGWHLSDIPYASHIGRKGDSGEIEYINENYVWCECEYADKINYQIQANKNGKNKKGIIIPRMAYLKEIPYDGFYRYKTNPNMYGDWIISGTIKVNRIMSDEEVNKILIDKGIKPMPRYGGCIDLAEYGLTI